MELFWEHQAVVEIFVLAALCVYLVSKLAKIGLRLDKMEEDFNNRAMLLPAGPVGRPGPVGPAGPPGMMGAPGPSAPCRCEGAAEAVKDARTPQEKRLASMELHRLIREGKMKAPAGWKPPRVRKKKARRKKKNG